MDAARARCPADLAVLAAARGMTCGNAGRGNAAAARLPDQQGDHWERVRNELNR